MVADVPSATLKFDTDFDFDSSNAQFMMEQLKRDTEGRMNSKGKLMSHVETHHCILSVSFLTHVHEPHCLLSFFFVVNTFSCVKSSEDFRIDQPLQVESFLLKDVVTLFMSLF